MAASELTPRPFEVEADGVRLAGEEIGEGRPVVTLHGVTATRKQVLHGSKALPRAGFRVISYDARGHGESEPAPDGRYGYDVLSADLGAVLADRTGEGRAVLVGHSMGAHTATAYALTAPERIAALVLAGPAVVGTPPPEENVERWEELADALEREGLEGFLDVLERHGIDPEWRDAVLRFTRERLERHRHPEAVAEGIRQVTRSIPFDGLGELEHLEVPVLVVASHDKADPGHPYDVAAAWAERLPQGRLLSEEQGASPLAWQGGRLSREIAAFCEEDAVAARLDG